MFRITALTLAVLAVTYPPAARADDETEAAKFVEKLGGKLERNDTGRGGPTYEVRLCFTPITDADLKRLAPLKGLTVLDLSYTAVTDGGLTELAGFNSLSTLDLSHTAVTDGGLKALAPLKALTTLTLPHTQVTDAALAALREAGLLHALPVASAKDGKRATKPEGVDQLYLYSTAVTDAGLKELAPLKNLTLLTVSENQITDVSLASLRKVGLLHALSVASAKDGKRPPSPRKSPRLS